MRKFSQPLEKNNLIGVPPYPATCQKTSCGDSTNVVFMRVFNKNTNQTEVGCVGGHTGKPAYASKNNNLVVMNEPFQFIGWITRCGGCYQIDLERQRKRAFDYCKEYAIKLGENK